MLKVGGVFRGARSRGAGSEFRGAGYEVRVPGSRGLECES